MYKPIAPLYGSIIEQIDGMEAGSEKIVLHLADGRTATFWHDQDCCEHVEVCDVDGDPEDLIGLPLLAAETVSSDAKDDVSESGTWTFYRFATANGWVVVRWLGESNGYYSESVDFRIV